MMLEGQILGSTGYKYQGITIPVIYYYRYTLYDSSAKVKLRRSNSQIFDL